MGLLYEPLIKYKLSGPKSRLSGVKAVACPLVFFRHFLESRYYNDNNIKKRAGGKQGERTELTTLPQKFNYHSPL